MKSDAWRREPREDVTLFEVLNTLLGRKLLIGGTAVTLMLSAALLAFLWSPNYVATAALSVDATDDALGPEDPASGGEDPAGQPAAAHGSEAFMDGVRGEVPQVKLARETVRRVGWTSGLREFNERIEVENDYRAGEILVSFSAEEAEEARRVTDTYAEVFAEQVDELNRQKPVGGTLAAEIEVVRKAKLPRARATTSLFYGAVAGFVGLLLASGVAFSLESRTRKWRGARDAEMTLRAPVLGVIPDYTPGEEKVG